MNFYFYRTFVYNRIRMAEKKKNRKYSYNTLHRTCTIFFLYQNFYNLILKFLVTVSSLEFYLILAVLTLIVSISLLSVIIPLYRWQSLFRRLSLALLFIPEIPCSMEKCSFVGRIHPRIANSERFLRTWKFL